MLLKSSCQIASGFSSFIAPFSLHTANTRLAISITTADIMLI